MEPPGFLVEAARGPEVCEMELAPRVLDAVAQHVERAAPLDLGREALEELRPHARAVVLLELLHSFGCVASTKSTTSRGRRQSARS
jgi:hypothetical protein